MEDNKQLADQRSDIVDLAICTYTGNDWYKEVQPKLDKIREQIEEVAAGIDWLM